MVIATIISWVIHIYSTLIVVYCLLTWFPIGGGLLGDIFEALSKLVRPYLNIFRKIIPPLGGAIDFSPVIAIVVLEFVGNLLIRLLY